MDESHAGEGSPRSARLSSLNIHFASPTDRNAGFPTDLASMFGFVDLFEAVPLERALTILQDQPPRPRDGAIKKAVYPSRLYLHPLLRCAHTQQGSSGATNAPAPAPGLEGGDPRDGAQTLEVTAFTYVHDLPVDERCLWAFGEVGSDPGAFRLDGCWRHSIQSERTTNGKGTACEYEKVLFSLLEPPTREEWERWRASQEFPAEQRAYKVVFRDGAVVTVSKEGRMHWGQARIWNGKNRRKRPASSTEQTQAKRHKESLTSSPLGSGSLERYWRNMPAKAVTAKDGSPIFYPRKTARKPSGRKSVTPISVTPMSIRKEPTMPLSSSSFSFSDTSLSTAVTHPTPSSPPSTSVLATPPAMPLRGAAESRDPRMTLRISVPVSSSVPAGDDSFTTSSGTHEPLDLPIPKRFKPAFDTLCRCAERFQPVRAGPSTTPDYRAFANVGADLCEAALEIRNGWRYTALRLAETTLKVTSQGRLEAEARGLTKGLNDKVKTLQAARDGLRDQLRLVRQKHTADVADLRAENVAGLAEKEKECSELVRLVRVELERVEDELQQAISKVETVEGERAANQIDFDEAIAAKDKECLELLGRTRRTNRRLCHTLDLSKTRVASLVRQRVGLQTEHDAAIAAKDEECLTIVARMWVARRRLQRQLDGAFEAQSASRVQLDSCRAESATRDAQHRIDMDELQATSDAAHDRLTALQASKDALQAELSTTLAAKESLLLTLDKLQQKTNRREAELEGLRTDLNDAGNSLLEALAKEQNNEALIIRLRNELAEERSNMETARAEQLAAERSTPEAQQAAERTVANVADKDSTIRQLRVRLADEQAATRRAERERARALEQRDEANRLRECADSALCQGTAYNRQRVEALQREVASEQRKRVALEDRLRQLQRPSEAREKRQQEEELPGEGDVAVFHAEQQVGLQARGIVDGSDLPKLRWELRTGQTALKNANLERQKDRAELQAQQAKLGSETARADDLAKATALAKSEKAEIKAGLETLRRQLKHLVEWMNFEDGQERSAAETRSALREKAASHEVRATAADQAMPLLRQVSELKVTITRLEHGLEKAGAKTEEVNHERPLERSQSAEADRQELERVKAQLEAMERDRTSIYAERAELADLRDEVLRLRRDLAELKTTLELEEQTAEALLDDAYQAGKELDELGVELNDAATARSAEEESSRAERAKVASRRRRELELLENPEFCNDVDGASAADRDAELEEIRGLQQRYEAEDEMAGWGIAQMRIVEEYRQAVEKLRSQAREAERARMRGPSVLDVLHTTRKVGESDVLRRLVEGILWERADCGGDAGSSWASSSLENSA